MKAELTAWSKVQPRLAIVRTLSRWQTDSDLAGLRDAGALARLPAEEQKAFTRFWAEVAKAAEPANNAERVAFARIAYDREQFAVATRLYVDAFVADPTLADGVHPGNRYDAARVAALTGSGRGKDAPLSRPSERATAVWRWAGSEITWHSRSSTWRPARCRRRRTCKAGCSPGESTPTSPPSATPRPWPGSLRPSGSGGKRLWADVDSLLKRAATPIALQSKLADAHRRAHALEASNPSEAEPLFRQALEGYRKTLGPDGHLILDLTRDLANLLDRTGRGAEAEPLFRDALERARKQFGPDDPRTAGILASLGLSLVQRGKWTEAEPVLRETLAIREKLQPGDWTTFNTRSLLGGSLLGQKKYAEAEPLIVSGYEGMKARQARIPPPRQAALHRGRRPGGQTLRRLGQDGEGGRVAGQAGEAIRGP